MPKKKISVSLDEELVAELEKRGDSISAVIEDALRRCLSDGQPAEVEGSEKKEVELVRIKASKYPYTCRRCGVRYDAGSPGWWDPASKSMICDACYYSSLSMSKHGGKLYKLLLEQKRLEAEIRKLREEEKEILDEIKEKEERLKELAKKYDAMALVDQLAINVQHVAKAVEELLQNPQLAEEIRNSLRRVEELLPQFVRDVRTVGTNYD